MSKDSYEIGLGNSDTEIRRNAKLDQVSFWGEQAKKLSWFNQWTKTLEWNSPFAKWFIGGKINASYNTLDVHQTDKAKNLQSFGKGRMVKVEQLLMPTFIVMFVSLEIY